MCANPQAVKDEDYFKDPRPVPVDTPLDTGLGLKRCHREAAACGEDKRTIEGLRKEIARHRKRQEVMREASKILANTEQVKYLIRKTEWNGRDIVSSAIGAFGMAALMGTIVRWTWPIVFIAVTPWAGLGLMSVFDYFTNKPKFTPAEKLAIRLSDGWWYPEERCKRRSAQLIERAESINGRIARIEEKIPAS